MANNHIADAGKEVRLIDANALRVHRGINVGANLGGLRAIVLEKDIRNAPTVDAVEVVHGYVLPAEEPKKVLLDMKCGICDQLMLSTDCYCPMCGTKMDGERKDNA